LIGGKAGQTVDAGLTTEVTWSFEGNTLTRTERISAAQSVAVKRFWLAVPSTGSTSITSIENGRRKDTLQGRESGLEVSVDESSVPLKISLQATGNSALGKGSRGAVPLILHLESPGLVIAPGKELIWKLSLRTLAASRLPSNP